MVVLSVQLVLGWRMGNAVLRRMLVLLDVCCRVLVLQHVWNVILDTLKPIKDNVSPFLVISLIVSTAPIILHAKFVLSATHSIHN